MTLGTNLKFYTSVTKGLTIKVRKFWVLIRTFVEVTGENLAGGLPILNRVNACFSLITWQNEIASVLFSLQSLTLLQQGTFLYSEIVDSFKKYLIQDICFCILEFFIQPIIYYTLSFLCQVCYLHIILLFLLHEIFNLFHLHDLYFLI